MKFRGVRSGLWSYAPHPSQTAPRMEHPGLGDASKINRQLNHLNLCSRLPIRDRAVRPKIGLGAGRDWFGDFDDLRELLEVEFNTQARTLIGIKFPVLEVQAHRQVRQGASFVVI